MSEFTMIFIDLDNTLIPSRMRKVIQRQLGFDIYHTLSSTLLKKLQYSIIKTLVKIKAAIQQDVIIAVVTNANITHIEQLLKYTQNKHGAIFPILAKYLKTNNIGIHSAMNEMYNELRTRYGIQSASEMFEDIHSGKDKNNNEKKWIWKYTTFSAILLRHKKQMNKQCCRIISLGDGNDEATALYKYSSTFGTVCHHINFVDSPTIGQIEEQWKHIGHNIADILNRNDSQKLFNVYNLREIFVSDNNKKGSGDTHQIKAVVTYFELWMNDLEEHKDAQYRDEIIEKVVVICRNKLCSSTRTKHLKRMVYCLRTIKAFDSIWCHYDTIVNTSNNHSDGDIRI